MGTPMTLIRPKYLAEVGGFDEDMPFLEDWECWLRLARRYKFACLPEQLCRVHEGGTREHVNIQDGSKKLKTFEILISKNEDGLLQNKYAYWLRLHDLMFACVKCGEYRRFFTLWVKSVTLQPLRVLGNTLILMIALTVNLLTSRLRKQNYALFVKLKEVKRKLKGVFTH